MLARAVFGDQVSQASFLPEGAGGLREPEYLAFAARIRLAVEDADYATSGLLQIVTRVCERGGSWMSVSRWLAAS